jgi:hypothetical protein
LLVFDVNEKIVLVTVLRTHGRLPFLGVLAAANV